MAHGDLTKLARLCEIEPQILHNYLTGRRNARSPETAKLLGSFTSTDPFLWMQGGSPLARQAAIESWSEKSVTASQGQGIQNNEAEV